LARTFSTDKLIRELMYESLLDMDEKGNFIPKLAESWEISKDGRVYTFHLRKGVKYHDGKEMTAADAKFAIDYTLNPKNGAYGRQRIIIIERAEAADKNTLRVYLKQPSASFLAVVTDIMAFSVIPQGSVEEGVEKSPKYPPGTGPFKFVEWVPSQRIVFERFADYWGHKANLDRVVLRPIPDDTVRFTALRAGDVDIVERTPYPWVKQLLDGKIKGITASEAVYADYRAIFFNVADPPFDNIKLRQAVAHAMNKEELLRATYFGFGRPSNQKYPEGHVWHVNGLPSPAHDPDKARQLLKEAGYKGETIEMKVEQGQVIETMSTTLQSQLKKVGMNIKITVQEYGSRRDQIRRGESTLDLVGSDFYADPATTYRQELACEPNPKVRTGNWTGYCNKDRDAMFDKLELEFDPQKRKEILRQILIADTQALALIPIGFAPRFYTVRDRVKGFATDDNGAFVWSGGGLGRTWVDK
jgi:peptide/nickel transport system substrate-binding protein